MAYKQPIPIFRKEANIELQSWLRRILVQFPYPYQNCLNCKNWDAANDQCGLYKAKPPTEIIVYSCEAYIDSHDIPF